MGDSETAEHSRNFSGLKKWDNKVGEALRSAWFLVFPVSWNVSKTKEQNSENFKASPYGNNFSCVYTARSKPLLADKTIIYASTPHPEVIWAKHCLWSEGEKWIEKWTRYRRQNSYYKKVWTILWFGPRQVKIFHLHSSMSASVSKTSDICYAQKGVE